MCDLQEPDYGNDVVVHAAPETTYDVRITVEGYGASVVDRFVGCVMIGLMPERGLAEALDSLRDMLQFYSQEPTLKLPAPHKHNVVDATVVERRERPGITIAS